jgi:hypothetical protein
VIAELIVTTGSVPAVRFAPLAGLLGAATTNGAGTILDWELAFFGRTEESVLANVPAGADSRGRELGRMVGFPYYLATPANTPPAHPNDPPAHARAHHATLVREVVRMLAAGVVHGDLSEFNILVAADGPVIIDLPQAVDAAGNNHAAAMLERDVANLRHYFGRFAPELLATDYGREIWALYEKGLLTPDSQLTGIFTQTLKPVNLGDVLAVIDDAKDEEAARQLRMQTPR